MHELSLTRNVVAIVSEHAAGRRVTRVALDVGRLSGVMSDALLFCFDVVARGTPLEGARLEIRDVAATARCRRCSHEFETPELFTPCPCGSREVERLSGEELKIREFEYDETEASGTEAVSVSDS